MKRLIKYWYVGVILLLIGIGLWFWLRPKPKTYQEFAVSQEPLKVTLSVSGKLDTDKKADLAFQTGGRLSWVGVKEGQKVKKWQAIASLDRRSVEKNLLKELNDYLKTRWDFQGNRETYNVSTDNLDNYTLTPAARRVLEKSQFDLNNSVLDVEIQDVAREFSTLISPIDGIVASVSTPNSGVNVLSTTPVATVVDPDSLYFEAQVDELDIGEVNIGDPVRLTLDAYPNEELAATVLEIDFLPITLSGGGTGFNVKISLPAENQNLKYKLGMNGDAEIIVAEKPSALVLPLVAAIQRDGQTIIQQLKDGKLIQSTIQTGLESEDKIEVVSGLAAGDKVVIPNGSK